MGLDNNAFISLVFYVAYAAVVCFPYLIRRTSLRTLDPLAPYLVLSFLLFFYTMSTLVGFETSGLTNALESVSSYSVAKYALACLIGQFGLAAGELAGPVGSGRPAPAQQSANQDPRLMLLVGPALVLAVLLLPFYVKRFDLFHVASYADTAFESRIARALDQSAGPKDVFLQEVPISIVLCACTALLLDRARWVPIRLGAGAVLGAYATTSLLAGSRGVLVATALLPVMYFHYRIRKVSPLVVAFFAVVGFLLMNALSIARVSSNPEEMIAAVSEQIGTEGYGFLEVSQSGELQTSTNLVRLIVGIDTGEDAYRWGMVTVSNILSTIPRTLWPDRPPTGSELFVEVFYPGVLESGGGYGSFIFQDPYWDFGFSGVFVFALGLTWAMRKLYVALILNDGSPFWVLLYTVVYGNMVIAVVRSGIFGGIKASLVSIMPLLLIAAIVRFAPAKSPMERPHVG